MGTIFPFIRSRVVQYPLVTVVVAAALVHAAIFFVFLARGDAAFLRSNDSTLYLTAANNIQQFHRFAETAGNPPEPSMFTMPGYAAMLALTTGVVRAPWFTALLQNILSLLTVVVVYRLLQFSGMPRLAFWGALGYGVEPFTSYQSNLLMTDTLFTFLMMGGLYAYVRALHQNSTAWIAMSAVALALAAYVRLIGLFFCGLLLAWWIGYAVYRKLGMRRLAAAGIFLVVLSGMLAPWVVRNGRTFGVWKLSTESNFVLYLFHANQALALRDHRTPQEVRGELITYLDALPQDVAVRDRFLGRRSREILLENWRWYLPVWAVKIAPFFVQSGWRDIVEIAGFKSADRPVDLTGALLHQEWGKIASAFRDFDLPLISHLIGALVWTIISLLAAIAPIVAWRSDRQRFPYLVLFGLAVLMFAALSSPISHARYRQPVQPLMIALAAYAVIRLSEKRSRISLLRNPEISK
ncbi:MAG: glycosyltransferase family 39 protein [Patescibacteria group bacterium]|nr:glycosyltransferase family 39 protein [Patescibacteria group bacterium]